MMAALLTPVAAGLQPARPGIGPFNPERARP